MLKKLFAQKLSKEEQDVLVQKVRQFVLSRVTPKEVFIFGSLARHEMTSASDVDVAIIVDRVEEIKPMRRMLLSLTSELGWPTDLLIFESSDFQKRAQVGGAPMIVFEDGMCLYKRGESIDSL